MMCSLTMKKLKKVGKRARELGKIAGFNAYNDFTSTEYKNPYKSGSKNHKEWEEGYGLGWENGREEE